VKAGGRQNLLLDPENGGNASCFEARFLLDLFSDPEDGIDMFLRNVG
jgi:hypothetical protein